LLAPGSGNSTPSFRQRNNGSSSHG
jgi:hypothetical protein